MDCPYCDRPYLILRSDRSRTRVLVTHRFECEITDAENAALKRELLALYKSDEASVNEILEYEADNPVKFEPDEILAALQDPTKRGRI